MKDFIIRANPLIDSVIHITQTPNRPHIFPSHMQACNHLDNSVYYAYILVNIWYLSLYYVRPVPKNQYSALRKEVICLTEQVNKIRTSALFRLIFKTSSIKEFMENYADEMRLPSFGEYITGLCLSCGEVPERIIKRANIERSFGHQLFKGTKKPSRDTVLQLAFGFEADVDTAQELLKHAGMSALYPRVKRDTAILYCLHNHFTIVDTQNVLNDMSLPLIGGGKRNDRCESRR